MRLFGRYLFVIAALSYFGCGTQSSTGPRDREQPALEGQRVQSSAMLQSSAGPLLQVKLSKRLSQIRSTMDAKASARLLLPSGQAVMAKSYRNGSLLHFPIPKLADGTTPMKLKLSAEGQQLVAVSLEVPVDQTAPVATVGIPPGGYSAPLLVRFICSEASVVHYTTDATKPISGISQKLVCEDGITEPISLVSTTSLQYFAEDGAGNASPIQGANYLLQDGPLAPEPVSFAAEQTDAGVVVSWSFGDVQASARILIGVGTSQCSRLERAALAKQLPPSAILGLDVTGLESITLPFQNLFFGIHNVPICFALQSQPPNEEEYFQDASPSSVVAFTDISSIPAQPLSGPGPAFSRGVYWLAAKHGHKTRAGMVDIFRLYQRLRPILPRCKTGSSRRFSVDKVNCVLGPKLIRQTLRELEHRIADESTQDIGELAERILASWGSPFGADRLLIPLFNAGQFSLDGRIDGWGATRINHPDPIRTALGIMAVIPWVPEIATDAARFLTDSQSHASDGEYSWVPHQLRNPGASALIYYAMNADSSRFDWIVDAQQENGAIVDTLSTAMVLRWISEGLPDETIIRGRDYLLSQQSTNGSWNNDFDLTIEALAGIGRSYCITDELACDAWGFRLEEDSTTASASVASNTTTVENSPVQKAAASLTTDFPQAQKNVIGEAGRVSCDQQTPHQTIHLSNQYHDPIIVMGATTNHSAEPVHSRVIEAKQDQFSFQLEEWPYLDGQHVAEECPYLVVEHGSHHAFTQNNQVRMDAGKLVANQRWTRISFTSPFTKPPVVVAGIMGHMQDTALTVRIQEVTTEGFSIRIQTQQTLQPLPLDAQLAGEIVGWVAVEPVANNNTSTLLFASTHESVSHQETVIPIAGNFPSRPILVANVVSFTESDPVEVHYWQSPGGEILRVKLTEDTAVDDEIVHAGETLSYIFLTSGPIRGSPATSPTHTPIPTTGTATTTKEEK